MNKNIRYKFQTRVISWQMSQILSSTYKIQSIVQQPFEPSCRRDRRDSLLKEHASECRAWEENIHSPLVPQMETPRYYFGNAYSMTIIKTTSCCNSHSFFISISIFSINSNRSLQIVDYYKLLMEADGGENKEQDRYLPIANIGRIMKQALPGEAKISKEARETVQECVSEFISFITSEASDKCKKGNRKTINHNTVNLYYGKYKEAQKAADQKGGSASNAELVDKAHEAVSKSMRGGAGKKAGSDSEEEEEDEDDEEEDEGEEDEGRA